MSGRLPRALLAGTAALAAILAGCGGDDALSAEEYRERLDAACRATSDALLELPAIQREEELTIDELRARADEVGDEYVREVEELSPPDELEDAHDELLALGEEEDPYESADPEVVLDFAQRSLAVYESLGAEGCAEGQRRAVEQLQAVAEVQGGG